VRDAHATACRHVKAGQLATLVDNSDKADIVRENVDIVNWWDCNSDFELKNDNQIPFK
jgi:hypothetical protein